MRTVMVAIGLFALLLLSRPSRGQEKPRLANLLALQEELQDVIAETEVSVACILVSRSTDYDHFHAAPPDPAQGKLGRFDSEPFRREYRNLVNQKEKLERLNAVDLAYP